MSGSINAQSTNIYNSYRAVNDRLSKVMEQASRGTRLLHPGDEPTNFDRVASLGVDRALDAAHLQAIQNSTTWYQVSTAYLEEINNILTTMSELSIRARDASLNATDRQELDKQFQGYKEQISSIVDGKSGQTQVGATFNSQALFLGYGPDVEITPTALAGKLGFQGINLFTGYGIEGYYELGLNAPGATSPSSPELTGTADAGSATDVTLDVNASSIAGIYVGARLDITNGTGVGQTATITGYDPMTRVATLDTTLAVPLDNTSEYRVTSPHKNLFLEQLPGLSNLAISSFVWGADNDRMDVLQDSQLTFRALTPEEETYRTLNGIPGTDLIPKTDAEKAVRRELNLFDPELGHIKDAAAAERMMDVLAGAINQVSRLITHQGAAQENLQQQFRMFSNRTSTQDAGISSFKDVDPAKAITEIRQLTDNAETMMGLAVRLSQNLGKLNQLVQNRGGSR